MMKDEELSLPEIGPRFVCLSHNNTLQLTFRSNTVTNQSRQMAMVLLEQLF